jgi:hypothetical protein
VELAYRCILCDVPFNVLKKTHRNILTLAPWLSYSTTSTHPTVVRTTLRSQAEEATPVLHLSGSAEPHTQGIMYRKDAESVKQAARRSSSGAASDLTSGRQSRGQSEEFEDSQDSSPAADSEHASAAAQAHSSEQSEQLHAADRIS